MVKAETLLEKIGDDISSYLMAGTKGHIPAIVFEPKNFNYTEMEKYADIEELMQIHFMLQEEIVEFIENLSWRLRSIKTETKRQTYEGRDIRGSIEWGETYETRYARNYKDRSLFVSADPKEEYNVPENLVLKKFLFTLYHILKENLEQYLREEEGYEWIRSWGNLAERKSNAFKLKRTFEKNIHLSRIVPAKKITITQRMLHRAKSSRKILYRKAAAFYTDYQDYLRGKKEKVRELLKATSIRPDEESRIFEIYFLFKLIKAIRKISSNEITQKPVKRNRKWTALFSGEDHAIKVYYDMMPSEFQINERKTDKGDRRKKVDNIYGATIKHYFHKEDRTYTRRPDAIVTIDEENKEKPTVLLFEVKFSSKERTICQGIKELSEYLGFLREKQGKNEYFLEKEDLACKGALIVSDFPNGNFSEKEGDINPFLTILSYHDLEKGDLSEFLKKASHSKYSFSL